MRDAVFARRTTVEIVTSTASSGGTESSTPLTFQQAFAADASPASSTPTSESTTPPAAAQPGTEADATPADERSPFIPRDRFDEVNTKFNELKTWKEQYGWAEQIPQAALMDAIRIAQRAQTDPIAYLQDFIKDLQGHPTHGAQLKSLAAKALAARTQPQGPDLTPIQVQLENGQTVPLYSADQIAALKTQWLDAAKQQFQPITQTVEQLQAERAEAHQQADIARYVDTTFKDAATWPGMDEPANRKAVAETLASMHVEDDDPRAVTVALNAAYRKVVLPTLSQKTEAKLLDSLKTKAAASSTVNPGSTGTASPPRVTSFYDASLQWK